MERSFYQGVTGPLVSPNSPPAQVDTLSSIMDSLREQIALASKLREVSEGHAARLAGGQTTADGKCSAPKPIPNGHVESLKEILDGFRNELSSIEYNLHRIASAL